MRTDDAPHAQGPADEAFIRRALKEADLNALRVALYQVTGDERLARMKLKRAPGRGGQSILVTVADEEVPELEDAAARYLLSGPHQFPAPPDDAQLRALMQTLTGEELDDDDFAYRRDIPGFDDYPRAASWTSGRSPLLPGFTVAIIGAGFSGLAAACQFQHLGIPYVIYERRSAIGGTWNINAYPDVRVDTTNFIYQYSFEKHYPWTEYFARAGEVKDYLLRVATKYGIYQHIAFNSDITAAAFDPAAGHWVLTIKRPTGTATARASVIVAASGLFSTPKKPAILGHFAGPVVHTSQWTGTEDIAGKRVAVIGNGSTGVQLLSRVARQAAEVSVYQRTPQWIAPRERYGEPISAETRWLLDTMPCYMNWYIYSMLELALGVQDIQEYDPAWQAAGGQISQKNDKFRAILQQYIQSKTGSCPGLAERLTPSYPPVARRLIVDNHWYDTLLHDHVELVTDPITQVTPTSIITADGTPRPADLIIAATGFNVSKYVYPARYTGADGRTLDQAWSESGTGPRAYLGLTVPGFPNLFLMYGPNAQPRSGSVVSWFEIWARYIAQAVITMTERGHRTMTVRQDVFDDYNTRLDQAAQRLIWMEPTIRERNYYVNEYGRLQVGAPWRVVEHYKYLAAVNPEDFDFE